MKIKYFIIIAIVLAYIFRGYLITCPTELANKLLHRQEISYRDVNTSQEI